MSGIALPSYADLSQEARALYDQLTVKRGRIDGMYKTLLLHPDLLRHVSGLGTYLRFESPALTAQARELAVLAVARSLGAAYEWVKHAPQARKAGLDEAVLTALRAGGRPEGLSPELSAVLDAARCVLEKRSIPEAVQSVLEKAYGVAGVIELVVLCGFYVMIAGVILAFDVPLPEGEADPFAKAGAGKENRRQEEGT